MTDPTITHALDVLCSAEAHCGLLPPPTRRRLTVRGWELIDHDDLTQPDGWQDALPFDVTRRLPEGTTQTSVELSAPLVRFSKFSAKDGIRLRAYYPHATSPLTMKLLVADLEHQRSLRSEIEVRRTLSALGQYPMLPLAAEGFTDTYAYLLEPIVIGTHPPTAEAKIEVTKRAIASVLHSHRTAGVTDERLTWHGETVPRIQRLLSWMDRPSRRQFLRKAKAVINSKDTLAFGWCHGDLVFSNLIVDGDDNLRFIDWEHAHRGPIASDLGKLITSTNAAVAMAAVVERNATPDDIGQVPGRQSVRHQLAASVLRELSWWEGKRTRAEAAGRSEQFGRWLDRRFELVDALLSDGPLKP